jgi:hypothetical protein
MRPHALAAGSAGVFISVDDAERVLYELNPEMASAAEAVVRKIHRHPRFVRAIDKLFAAVRWLIGELKRLRRAAVLSQAGRHRERMKIAWTRRYEALDRYNPDEPEGERVTELPADIVERYREMQAHLVVA